MRTLIRRHGRDEFAADGSSPQSDMRWYLKLACQEGEYLSRKSFIEAQS
jgi:hypothetical protein